MKGVVRLAATALAFSAAFGLSSCGGGQPRADFTIVSGSENESLEPIVQRFCEQQRMRCDMRFEGSLDIGLSLRPGEDPEADAVWPASSLWIDLYDTERRVRDVQSIYQTPVVLGVRLSKARELGWIGRPVRMRDILQAVEDGRLSFLMTSATQSNSGASAYLAMLASALGSPENMTLDQIENPRALDTVRRMLRGVARSAGSSGWLGHLYRDTAIEGQAYDAMWNYEAVLKETNDALRQNGLEPLYAIYPVEGSAIADAPLGYVEHGQDARTRAFFTALQAYLTGEEAQAEIARLGRRIALGRAAPAQAEPDWNFDPARLVTAIPPPEPEIIRRALNLYQEALRRPSLTALCLDFSGSMEGEGEAQLQQGMDFLFSPARTSEALVQWSPRDRIVVIPFNHKPLETYTGTGAAEDQSRLLRAVQSHDAGGGTNMYACAEAALALMAPDIETGGYLPAIVLMTDGRSRNDRDEFLRAWRAEGHQVPVFGITYGDADADQLDELAQQTRARVFDGEDNLADAFRAARGYN